jgi:glucan phosphoethanolaminetransferase (alkaline phosphatase superfamily)
MQKSNFNEITSSIYVYGIYIDGLIRSLSEGESSTNVNGCEMYLLLYARIYTLLLHTSEISMFRNYLRKLKTYSVKIFMLYTSVIRIFVFGRAQWMGEMRTAYGNLVVKSSATRPFRRTRTNWEDNIETSYRKLEGGR